MNAVEQLSRAFSVTRPCTLAPRRDTRIDEARAVLGNLLNQALPTDEPILIDGIREAMRLIDEADRG